MNFRGGTIQSTFYGGLGRAEGRAGALGGAQDSRAEPAWPPLDWNPEQVTVSLSSCILTPRGAVQPHSPHPQRQGPEPSDSSLH